MNDYIEKRTGEIAGELFGDKTKESFKRKLKIRKFAYDNLGLNEDKVTCQAIDEKTFVLFAKEIEEANLSAFQNGYSALQGSKVKVFVKKVLRKFIKISFGWYIFPIYQQQSHFNGKVLNSLTILKDILQKQEQELSEYNQKIDEPQIIKKLVYELQSLEEIVEKQNISVSQFQNKIEFEMIKELTDKLQFLESITEQQNKTISMLQSKIESLVQNESYLKKQLGINYNIDLVMDAPEIDYFDFENHFRGKRELIKERQRAYVNYFKNVNGGATILDIGCGRGEFLELMYDNNIQAYGIDCYRPFVNYCINRGFCVEENDALTHLMTLQNASLGGVFMSQVVEHLNHDYLLMVLQTIYEKLKPGCYFILETPNAEVLTTYRTFYTDLSHRTPIHYATLEYLLYRYGFSKVLRYDNELTKDAFQINYLGAKDGDSLEHFNGDIDFLNQILFGCHDYTIIAQK